MSFSWDFFFNHNELMQRWKRIKSQIEVNFYKYYVFLCLFFICDFVTFDGKIRVSNSQHV